MHEGRRLIIEHNCLKIGQVSHGAEMFGRAGLAFIDFGLAASLGRGFLVSIGPQDP